MLITLNDDPGIRHRHITAALTAAIHTLEHYRSPATLSDLLAQQLAPADEPGQEGV